MGGIGKTTTAEEVFNKLCSEYEGGCFLSNLREESRRHGIIYLKEKLFSALLAENVKISTPNGLSNDIKRRIGRMKVLIVLDDVNDSDHLEELFGTGDYFGPGSRIIVTSRDKQVLIANNFNDIYEVGVLSSSEALKLFNLIAFNQSRLEMEYDELSKRVVNYAKGIPLVLKVLGHLLRGKDKEVWESQLAKLKEMPNKEVYDVMRLSYDDLDRKEKTMFLDTACFLNELNLKVGSVKTLLKDHESDNSVAHGLESLKDKALVTLSEDNVVSMHDTIQEMAWEIIRQDLGSQSRFGDADDINEVLKTDKRTKTIRSVWMHLSMIRIRKLKLSSHTFAKMGKLQFLDFYSEYDQNCLDLLPEGLQSLPTELRYLRWMYYPLNSLPEKFSAQKLVILDLSYSRVEKLWHGVQNLADLKQIELFGSEFLKEMPDFSKATNLEVLNFGCCYGLTSVHPSIFSLEKLEKLDLSYCSSLTRLTSDTHLSSLSYLSLQECENLIEFSVTSENMIELNLKSTGIKTLPPSFERQSKLEILVLESTEIESLPSCMVHFTRLRYLNIRECEKLQTIPELPPSLETLLTQRCKSLKTVFFPSKVAEELKENRQRVEFWNCLRLSRNSLLAIEQNAQLNLMKFADQHLSTGRPDYVENYDDYFNNYHSYQAVYVYPGSILPKWLESQTVGDFVTIDLTFATRSTRLGFVFCFIINADPTFGDTLKFNITFSCVGEDEEHRVEMCMSKPLVNASDHVCVVYDQRCSRYLNSKIKSQSMLQIMATTWFLDDSSQRRMATTGFGVSRILPSSYRSFIQPKEWDSRARLWEIETRRKNLR